MLVSVAVIVVVVVLCVRVIVLGGGVVMEDVDKVVVGVAIILVFDVMVKVVEGTSNSEVVVCDGLDVVLVAVLRKVMERVVEDAVVVNVAVVVVWERRRDEEVDERCEDFITYS